MRTKTGCRGEVRLSWWLQNRVNARRVAVRPGGRLIQDVFDLLVLTASVVGAVVRDKPFKNRRSCGRVLENLCNTVCCPLGLEGAGGGDSCGNNGVRVNGLGNDRGGINVLLVTVVVVLTT
jgi:hypothetical protein